MSVARYIESLTIACEALPGRLAERPLTFRAVTRGEPGPPPPPLPAAALPEDLQAAVDAGTLLSFVDGLSPQERDDVLFSVQLAHRGASGAFNRFTNTEAWYNKYMDILNRLGWAAEQLAFVRHDQSQGEIRMDQAALAVITAIATQNQLAVLNAAVKALEELAEEDSTIRLFDFQTAASASANFQIGAVQKADNGALGMAMGAFHVQGLDTRRRFLFFSWGAQKIQFWTAAQKMTLNTTFYAQHRHLVIKALGAGVADYIGGLTLA
ncbi:MAG: hypothetical protein AB1634_05065 [Thermodesulfobacteriota bacterium]